MLGCGAGGWWVHLDYSISSGSSLTLNFQFEPDHGPKTGPELDNLIKLTSPLSFKLIADTLVREISSVLCLNLSLARSVRPNLEPG